MTASTKRTRFVSFVVGCGLLPVALAQEPTAPTETDPVAAIVAEMRSAETALRAVALEMTTRGQLPGGLAVTTRGSLRVLRGTHPAIQTRLEYQFADGLRGQLESVEDADGVTIFEDNPAFGELHLRIAPKEVADLRWAGEVLQRSDLPGMHDARADAPLGSGMVADLQRHFELKPDGRKTRSDATGTAEPGVWLVGRRRPGLDVEDPDVPLADRVEVFVRGRDHALLEVRELQGDTELQHIVVGRLEVDPTLDPASFRVDARDVPLRDVSQHLPMWERIQKVLLKAEAKAGEGQVRPSRR